MSPTDKSRGQFGTGQPSKPAKPFGQATGRTQPQTTATPPGAPKSAGAKAQQPNSLLGAMSKKGWPAT